MGVGGISGAWSHGDKSLAVSITWEGSHEGVGVSLVGSEISVGCHVAGRCSVEIEDKASIIYLLPLPWLDKPGLELLWFHHEGLGRHD